MIMMNMLFHLEQRQQQNSPSKVAIISLSLSLSYHLQIFFDLIVVFFYLEIFFVVYPQHNIDGLSGGKNRKDESERERERKTFFKRIIYDHDDYGYV